MPRRETGGRRRNAGAARPNPNRDVSPPPTGGGRSVPANFDMPATL
ncbi:hypothetical protein BV133_1247 [Blastochloris viridis]|uniref:Uncharacterized protein n=1 Tax=Blastochloris viridis TaxID=1079 RepID=A0A182D043_BLAVI|nr:hypothetical protein BV133_1247 [Blastochloris viridis]